MYSLKQDHNRAGVLSVIKGKQLFTPDFLVSRGLEYKGNCWGNSNKPYYQIDTQIGSICIVDFKDVYLVRKRDIQLNRINSTEKLDQFLELLD